MIKIFLNDRGCYTLLEYKHLELGVSRLSRKLWKSAHAEGGGVIATPNRYGDAMMFTEPVSFILRLRRPCKQGNTA